MLPLDSAVPPGLCIALYKGTSPGLAGLYNRVVRWWDHGPYSHCELKFSDGMSCGASYRDGGVRLKNIQYSTRENWDWMMVFDPSGDLERNARAWAYAHAGKAYDIAGNLRFVIPLVHEHRDKWFCSEAILAMFDVPGAWLYGPNKVAAQLSQKINLLAQHNG